MQSMLLGGFRKPHDQAGFWSREGVGGPGTLYAQHKEAAACSFMEKVLLVLKHFLAWKVSVYQLCTQVPSKERLPSTETTLHLSLRHFQRPCICEHQGGRKGEGGGKAHMSTRTGPYYTHYVIVAFHLHDTWEDCSIFNGWAEKYLNQLINLTRQREPFWKATIQWTSNLRNMSKK